MRSLLCFWLCAVWSLCSVCSRFDGYKALLPEIEQRGNLIINQKTNLHHSNLSIEIFLSTNLVRTCARAFFRKMSDDEKNSDNTFPFRARCEPWLASPQYKTWLVLKVNFFVSGNISAKICCRAMRTSGTQPNDNSNFNLFLRICPPGFFLTLIRTALVFEIKLLSQLPASKSGPECRARFNAQIQL